MNSFKRKEAWTGCRREQFYRLGLNNNKGIMGTELRPEVRRLACSKRTSVERDEG